MSPKANATFRLRLRQRITPEDDASSTRDPHDPFRQLGAARRVIALAT